MKYLEHLRNTYGLEMASTTPKQVTVIRKAIKAKTLHRYKKFGEISARPAKEGEFIRTVINGKEETTNTAKNGDYVVTGVLGEEYIIGGEKLKTRYKATGKKSDNGEIYEAVGECYATEYKGTSFTFKAPWSENMIINKGDYMVTTDPKSIKDIYRIERDAFKATYKKA